jgi:hypothetical protein
MAPDMADFTIEQTVGHLTMFLVHFVEQANIDPEKTAFDIDSPIIGAPPTIVTLADVLDRAMRLSFPDHTEHQPDERREGATIVTGGEAVSQVYADTKRRMGLGGQYAEMAVDDRN